MIISITVKYINYENKCHSFCCRYGLWIATKIIHTCSKGKIESIFSKEELTLRANQVSHLFNRSGDLLEIYLDYYKKTFDKIYSESKIANYIAKKNPVLLFKLEKQKKISVPRLGKRTTKSVYILMQDDVQEEFGKYQKLLNQAVLIKKMGENFKVVYLRLFPKRINAIEQFSDCRTLLNYYPKSKRWALFVQTFQTKFPDKHISEIYFCYGKQIMSLNPSNEAIISWAEYSYKKNNDDKFLKYLKPSKSIPILKEKISLTSEASKRASLVKLLLQTCKKNNDLTALEEVLKYFCLRHRNEDSNFRINFLLKIESKFNLVDFNETHWRFINEQILILKLQKEVQFWRLEIFMKKHLEYLFKSGADFKQYLVEYVRFFIINYIFVFTTDLKNPVIEQKIFIEILNIFPDVIKTVSEKKQEESHIKLMSCLTKFCEDYPNYFIDLGDYSYLKTFIKKLFENFSDNRDPSNLFRVITNVLLYKQQFPQTSILENDDETIEMIVKYCQHDGFWSIREVIKKFLLKKNRNNFENQVLLTYFNVLGKEDPFVDIIDWFLKYEPNVLSPYFPDFCKKYKKYNAKLIKLLSHFEFDEQMRTIYKTQLESAEESDCNAVIIKCLRILMPTYEFVALIDNKFVPTKPKLDLKDDEANKQYHLQCQISKQLHKVEEPLRVIPVVLKFCIGDYFQYALPALQGVFHRCPEKELYTYADELSTKAVSVRKHAFFVSCEVLNQDHVLNILTTANSSVSSQKHLFTATLKYFRKNPLQELQIRLVSNMSTIDKNDSETLETLAKLNVPKKCKAFFMEKCWEFYERLQIEGIIVDKYLDKLLENAVDHIDIIVSLTSSLVENIINNYYFKTPNSFQMGKFIIKFLNNTDCSTEEVLAALLKKLSLVNKKNVKEFFNSLLNCSELTEKFVVSFSNHFSKQFTYANAFEEHLIVKLLVLNSSFHSTKVLAENIVRYMDEIILQYSLNAAHLLDNVFKQFISNKNDSEKYALFKYMLSNNPNAFIYILVLSAITPIDDEENEQFQLYQSIARTIEENQDPIVTIYYKKFITDYDLE